MARNERIPVGEKVKRAREAQVPKVGRKELGELAARKGLEGFDYHAIEVIERNMSEKRAKLLVPLLSFEWKIDEDWFWDGEDTPVPTRKFSTLATAESKSGYDVFGEQVDIALHILTNSGKVIWMDKGLGTTKILAGLAKRFEQAMPIGDTEMAPRFLSGNIVVLRPLDIYEDRCYVGAVKEDELIEGPDGKKHPRLYLRWYVYENGRFRLKARGDGEDFDANDLKIVGVAVALKVGGDDYYNIEVAAKALPFDKI